MGEKIALNDTLIAKLKIDERPRRLGTDKKLSSGENVGRKPYILYDAAQDSPVGFGVKVTAQRKTFVLQRRIGNRVLKAKVGDVADFAKPRFAPDGTPLRGEYGVAAARNKARALALDMIKTGRNPNVTRREREAGAMTLAMAFTEYKKNLVKKKKRPLKKNTEDAIDKALKRVEYWNDTPIKRISSNEVLVKFNKMAETTRTTAEQTFRWCTTAVNSVIRDEKHNAGEQERVAELTHNPFLILQIKGAYRTRQELAEAYEKKGVRNPLSAEKTLGNFLNALWDRRPSNPVGADYLLLMLLWGCRKSEHAVLRWRELIPEKDAESQSYVDLKERSVRFNDTKNGRNHWLPLGDAAYALLIRRQEASAERGGVETLGKRRHFVFPAVSKQNKTGHYSDAQTLLAYVREDAEIARLTRHDLRRTFGRIAEAQGFSELTIKRLLNHDRKLLGNYTDAEKQTLRERMQAIEDAILSRAPRVYNALKPAHKSPMPIDDSWTPKPLRRTKPKSQEAVL